MDLRRVDVVLVRPARASNVAAAARALKNMGLRSLALVQPPDELRDHEARAAAYGAWDVLDGARPCATLREAVAGCAFVAATSGRPHPESLTPRRLAAEAEGLAAGGRLAVVFGPEASGLTNDELAQADVRVHVPTDLAHPSLNLAQAVLLVAYEMRLAALAAGRRDTPPPERVRATAGELDEAFAALREALVPLGYLNPENPGAVLAELRALVSRAGPSPREVALLRGLARQLAWAAAVVAREKARP